MTKEKSEKFWQINCIFFIVFVSIAALIYRLVFLQVFKFDQYKAAAVGQHELYKEIRPQRGEVLVSDKNSSQYFPVATNKKSFLFYIVPKEIKDKEEFKEQLTAIVAEEIKRGREEMENAIVRINIKEDSDEEPFSAPPSAEASSSVKTTEDKMAGKEEKEDNAAEDAAVDGEEDEDSFLNEARQLLDSHLNNMDDPYEVILNDVSANFIKQTNNLKIKGIYFSHYYKRSYPQQEFLADILGFMGFKGDQKVGRYGLEELFNEELEGQSGFIKGEKDTQGRWVAIGEKKSNSVQNGCDIYLTIDKNVQYKVEEILKEAARLYKIKAGSVVVIAPKTGKIIAMADWPTFNPNYYNKFEDLNVFQNGAVQAIYEPGSIFKVITMSAAINEGKVTPKTTYNDEGFVKVGREIIRNSTNKPQNTVTMIEVLEKSLNTGAVFVQQSISEGVFLEYVEQYNFGQITGVKLKGEVCGSIASLQEKPFNVVNYAAASFGQGISVTPLEMVSAISAIANNGMLMKPYIIDKILQGDKSIIFGQQEIRQVISVSTAAKVGAMMVNVVKNGSGSGAAVKGYNIAGKTGTAQIAEKGVYTDKSIHSFVGFAPLDDPVFAMIVKLDEPDGFRFSSSTATPTFGKIAKFLLEYYAISPSY